MGRAASKSRKIATDGCQTIDALQQCQLLQTSCILLAHIFAIVHIQELLAQLLQLLGVRCVSHEGAARFLQLVRAEMLFKSASFVIRMVRHVPVKALSTLARSLTSTSLCFGLSAQSYLGSPDFTIAIKLWLKSKPSFRSFLSLETAAESAGLYPALEPWP